MKLKNKKKLKIFFLFLLIFFLAFLFLQEFKFYFSSADLKISFLDVGQGDACLLQFKNNKTILIDGGPGNLILHGLGETLPFYKRHFNLIVISHFHQDHIVGLIEVFRRYKVDNLIYVENLEQFYPAEILFTEAKKQNTNIIALEDILSWQVSSNCKLLLFNPFSSTDFTDANNSLVSKLECQEFSFLAAGDNEKEAEEIILSSSFNLKADLFKASHHGSNSSNSYLFLQEIKPEIIVFSVGADNKFKHPAPQVLKRAKEMKIKIRRTDKDGTISVLVDD